uniref:Uncharacterized protein n=1 Tax=Amphimedon queenslandica TaxID=400682 RepID=A0A1X7TVM5_AMPQE
MTRVTNQVDFLLFEFIPGMTNRFSCYPFFFGLALFFFPKFKKPEIHSVVYTRSDSLD